MEVDAGSSSGRVEVVVFDGIIFEADPVGGDVWVIFSGLVGL